MKMAISQVKKWQNNKNCPLKNQGKPRKTGGKNWGVRGDKKNAGCTRYDGTVESLYEGSHRPYSYSNQHTEDELKPIKQVWSHNKGLRLVCLHMVLEMKFGYTQTMCSLNRVMKRLGIGREKQQKKKYIPRPYYSPEIPRERVQIDIKVRAERMFDQRGSYISL